MENMQILLVEDSKTFAQTVSDSLRKIAGVEITLAESRDSAIRLLITQFFDVVVLDLAIPTTDNGLDRAPEHGQKVFYETQAFAPGTPVYILTGSDPDEFSLGLAKYGHQADLWGTGNAVSTIEYYVKDRVDRLIDTVERLARDVGDTDRITIDTWGKNLNLSVEHKRALRVFTRLRGGVSCLVHQVTGGLSDARTLRVSVRDGQAHERVLCIAKLGRADRIQRERLAMDNHVELLKMGVATPLLNHLYLGLHGFAGIFYPLAEGYDKTFFDTVGEKPNEAAVIPERLRDGMQRWAGAGNVREVSVGDIRRRMLTDDALQEIRGGMEIPRCDEVEGIRVRSLEASIHGDLHGGNVLVSGSGLPVLIDFGDVGVGFSCQDPVALELSLVFHPDGVAKGISAQLVSRLNEWPDIDAYTRGNPFATVIQACREWAYRQAGSDDAVLAAAYAYAIRQLKYPTIPAANTLQLIEAVAARLVMPKL
jgi:CheY-like chemotaxis protein